MQAYSFGRATAAAFFAFGFAVVAHGAITIDGDVSGVSTSGQASLLVGVQRYGSLRIDGDSDVVSSSASVGADASGSQRGLIDVSGVGSSLTAGNLTVRSGEVVISQGARLASDGQVLLGGIRSIGALRVTGAGSSASIGSLFVGSEQNARLEIGDGAFVGSNSVSVGARGVLDLADSTLSASSFTNNGVVRGSGEVIAQTSFTNNASIFVSSGNLLSIESGSRGFVNSGRIEITNGELQTSPWMNQTLDGVSSPGAIELQNGTLRGNRSFGGASSTVSTNSGLLLASGGDNHIYGPVNMSTAGQVVATNSSQLTFHDAVTFASKVGGGISVQAGSVVQLLRGLSMNSVSSLQTAIGGESPSSLGVIEVVGATTFTNTPIDVLLTGGFVPALGDTFGVLSSTGAITGAPVLRSAPPLAFGQRWEVVTTRNQVLLRVVTATQGDYNGDGVVNAADYTIWRDNFPSTSEAALNGAGSGDGAITEFDYTNWRSRYGTSGTALRSTAVPEPSAWLLLGLGALAANGTSRASNRAS